MPKHSCRKNFHASLLPLAHQSYTGNMEHSWNRDTTWSEGQSTERRGRNMSNSTLPRHSKPSSMAAHLSPLEIEDQILRSPELQDNYAAVILYLRLDIWLLESIFALRNSASTDLAELHPTLFASPPEPLFHLIYTLRHFMGLDLASTIAKIENYHQSGYGKERSRESGGSRVAPPGQAYGCPSKHCKKAFKKSGHAANHVEKQHPEYLKLHPDYQPSHFMVEQQRSRPASPELERQERPRLSAKPHELRPSIAANRTPSVASEGLSIYFSEGAGGHWDRPSPMLQGYDSQGDSDEAPRLIPSRGTNRTTNYPSPSYPVTPQEPHERSPNVSRYHVPVSHSKRGREHSSSLESVASMGQIEESNPTRFRRHAKRRSTFGIY